MIDSIELTDELGAVVRAVAGVSAVYTSTPVIATVVTQLVNRVIRERSGLPAVLVVEGESGTTVTVTVGVTDLDPATDVCRRVHDAILACLSARGLLAPAAIEVRVASIGA